MPEKITLAFDSKTLDYIANALAQRPWAEVQAIIADITQQVQAQGPGKALPGPQAALNGTGEALASAAH